MKGWTRRWLFAIALGAIFAPFALADDVFIDWQCTIEGSLSGGASASFSGSIQIGPDTVHDFIGEFTLPNALVGDGTGLVIGTIIITCDITAPEGIFIEDLWVTRLGQIIPGIHATNPYVAWTELVLDVTNPDVPVTLVSDSGVDHSLPADNHYVFAPSRLLRVKETFTLDGVTYNDGGGDVIDETASVRLEKLRKELSLVPEPPALAGAAVGLAGLLALTRRRR